MRAEDIAPGRTYVDGATAVRTVQDITNADKHDVRFVMCREHAGLNRNRIHSMPLEAFAAFARREIGAEDIPAAGHALGLDAYPLDPRTKDMIANATDGSLSPSESGDRLRLEKLVGYGLAVRDGPRLMAGSYLLGEEVLRAARRWKPTRRA